MKRNIDVLVEKVAALSKELFQEVQKRVNSIDSEKVKENLKEVIDEVCEAVKNPKEVRTSEVVEEEATAEGTEAVVETSEVKEGDPQFAKFCKSFKVSDSGELMRLADLTLKDLATITVIKFVVLKGFKSRKSLTAFTEKRMAEDGLDKQYIFNAKDQVDLMLSGMWSQQSIELWKKVLRIETAKLEWSYKGPLPEEDEVLEDKEGEIAMGGMGGFINLME